MVSVYDLGYQAFKDDLTPVDNPYDGTSLEGEWRRGWDDAYDHYNAVNAPEQDAFGSYAALFFFSVIVLGIIAAIIKAFI